MLAGESARTEQPVWDQLKQILIKRMYYVGEYFISSLKISSLGISDTDWVLEHEAGGNREFIFGFGDIR